MISLENSVKAIVDFGFKKEDSKQSLLIPCYLSFERMFEEDISDEVVHSLSETYPFLDISNRRVKVALNLNFLFITNSDYYACFYNNTDEKPLEKEESSWTLTTNNENWWEEAFVDYEEDIRKIGNAICTISKEHQIRSVFTPGHVTPTFSMFRSIEPFKFAVIDNIKETEPFDDPYDREECEIYKVKKQFTISK